MGKAGEQEHKAVRGDVLYGYVPGTSTFVTQAHFFDVSFLQDRDPRKTEGRVEEKGTRSYLLAS